MSINRERVERLKRAVAGILGDRCAHCRVLGRWPWEARKRFVPLEVNHKRGRAWSIRRPSRDTRWSRYLREALAGHLEATCGPCNRRHGGGLRYAMVDRTRQGARRRAA